MAENYSPDMVQAAVLRSAAGRAGQGDPAATAAATTPLPTTPNLQANAVRQDLGVLANQAGRYTAGVTQGNLQAIQQASATNVRLDEAKAQQDAQRAQQLELEQMAKQALLLKQQAQAQAAAQQIAEIRAAAAARARSASGGDDGAAGYEAGRQVRIAALGNTDPDTAGLLNFAFDNAHGKAEADQVYKGLLSKFPRANKTAFDAYYRSFYNAVNTGTVQYPQGKWGGFAPASKNAPIGLLGPGKHEGSK